MSRQHTWFRGLAAIGLIAVSLAASGCGEVAGRAGQEAGKAAGRSSHSLQKPAAYGAGGGGAAGGGCLTTSACSP